MHPHAFVPVAGITNRGAEDADPDNQQQQQQELQAAVAEAAAAAPVPAWLPPQQQQCGLERLELGSCGRGFIDAAAAALAAVGPLQRLSVLRLEGAYKLGDGALLKLLEACPNLKELAVPHASRLTG